MKASIFMVIFQRFSIVVTQEKLCRVIQRELNYALFGIREIIQCNVDV